MSNQVERFNEYLSDILPGYGAYDFTDKSTCRSQFIRYMLNRTQSMFKWDGLPDTIPARILELYLQCNGNACFYKHNGNLYVFIGGRGGEPDVYYMPTIYTIANPALKLNVSANIDIDCVVMPNDSLYMGLLPMFERYATSMVETELSIDIATVNARIIDLINATDDRTRESAEKFLEDVRDGKLGVISSNEFLSGLSALPYASTGHQTITDLIELMQYQKASWFNDLGLNANYNMKRESLNSSESQLNNDALLPLIDDMLKNRQEFAEKVNKMFGTNISCDLASSWEDNEIEMEAQQEILTAEPTEEPTAEPTEEPTAEPMEEPTAEPTEEPTAEPTEEPTAEPKEETSAPVEVVVTTDIEINTTEEPTEEKGENDDGQEES